MIKAVIFDMDGVLIDATEWHYEALNDALRLFGFEISRESHLKDYDGLPTAKKLAILSIQLGLPCALHGFINEMKQRYTMEIVHSLCAPRECHQAALLALKQRGYRMAVASNSVRNSVHTMMRHAQLDQYLDIMLSNEDVSQPKPSPEIYLKAISAFGLMSHECLVVEDNEFGIQAAKASGAHVLAVKNVAEVNIDNIFGMIDQIEKEAKWSAC